MHHHGAVGAKQPPHFRTHIRRVAASAVAAGIMALGVQAWVVLPVPAGASAPAPIFAMPYSQSLYFGPGGSPVSTQTQPVSRFALQRIEMTVDGMTDVFSLTISAAKTHLGFASVEASPTTFQPALELVKNPALVPASPSDPCNANCTFNLVQIQSGWVLNEYANGLLVTAAGPATVTVNGTLVEVTIVTSTLNSMAQKVLGDPTTDVQAGFVARAHDGSGEQYISNPYAIGSLTGLNTEGQVIGPWQGRLLGPNSVSTSPCSGNVPRWFTYNPATHQETIQFSQPLGPDVTVEAGGPDSNAALANFRTVVIQTAASPNGTTIVSSIGNETNNQPLVPVPVRPDHAVLAISSVTITVIDAQGEPLIPPGGFLTAAVSLQQATGTCIYHFPLVALAVFPYPTIPSSPATASLPYLMGGGAGVGIGAALLGILAVVGVLKSRSHARTADLERAIFLALDSDPNPPTARNSPPS